MPDSRSSLPHVLPAVYASASLGDGLGSDPDRYANQRSPMDRVDRRRTTSRPRAHPALNGHRGSPGSDEEDIEEVIPAQGPRASSRKRPGVDFSKLETASLRKYRTFYKLQDVSGSSSKEDLIPAVAKHFAQQVVDNEEATVMDFYHHIRKQSLARYSPPPTKKPRVAAKAIKANGR